MAKAASDTPRKWSRAARRPWIALIPLVWLACAVAPCRAQSLALPLDFEQGLVFGAERPRTPYLFAVRLAPSLDLEGARLSLVLGPTYRNPRWDFAVGGQLSLFLPFSMRDLGLRLAAQGEYLPLMRDARGSFGLIAEAFGLLRLGVWPAYDFEAKRAELTLSIGVDMVSWSGLITQGDDSAYNARR